MVHETMAEERPLYSEKAIFDTLITKTEAKEAVEDKEFLSSRVQRTSIIVWSQR